MKDTKIRQPTHFVGEVCSRWKEKEERKVRLEKSQVLVELKTALEKKP